MPERRGLLAGLRERAAALIDGGHREQQIREVVDAARQVFDAYLDGPYTLPPDELLRQLKEYDNAYLLDLVYQLQYERIGSLASYREDDMGHERELAVKESRRLWRYSILYQWSVNLWTSYGFGEGIEVIPDDEAAQPPKEKVAERLNEQDDSYAARRDQLGVWQEFWTADRNERLLGEASIYSLSEDALVDGNLFLCYYASEADGETTVTELDVDEMTAIIKHPEDRWKPLFYKRTFTVNSKPVEWWYPDWRAYFSGELDEPYGDEGQTLAEYVGAEDGKRADKVRSGNPGTVAVVQHVAHNRKDRGSLWGWPLSTTAAAWDRAHKQFLQNRLSVSASKALYVRKLQTQGGSRNVKSVVDQIATRLGATNYQETNPPAAAGSTFTHNQAVDFEDLPMRTGADDAKTDGEMFSWMPILGYGLFPHYAGQGDAYRLATASAMEKPLELQFSRYRKFWSTAFRSMLKIVLQFASEFGGLSFDTLNGQISTDKLVEADLGNLSSAVGTFYRDFLVTMNGMGEIPQEVMDAVNVYMLRLVLQAVGADEVTDIVNADAFKKARDEAPPEMPPETEEPETEEAYPVTESHVPMIEAHTCPFCGWAEAEVYEGHGNWVRCARCKKTYDKILEAAFDE